MEIINPEELSYDMALQLLAVFIRRFGGEAVISAREFALVEGLPVYARHITPEHLRLRLVEEHELCDDCGEPHLDEEGNPPIPQNGQ